MKIIIIIIITILCSVLFLCDSVSGKICSGYWWTHMCLPLSKMVHSKLGGFVEYLLSNTLIYVFTKQTLT